jgi:hypothetical protein
MNASSAMMGRTTAGRMNNQRWTRHRRMPSRVAHHPRLRRAVILHGIVVLAITGCAPTARTAGPYVAKAVKTAQAVHSALGSDLLLLDAVGSNHTTAAYVSVATSDAEDDASTAASTFLSIQPPDENAQQLRDQLSDLLDRANADLGAARIAGRRGDRDGLLAIRGDLADVDQQLRRFADDHQ